MATHIFGIRHHGPGSARHLVQALDAVKPEIILLEGPPEAEGILSWVNDPTMEPPVAILAYVPDNPHNAVFYPFTHYSPEWQAILYGLKNNIPIRFIDMPLVHKLAEKEEEIIPEKVDKEEPVEEILEVENEIETEEEVATIRRNPISYLAEIAGLADAEEWWEQNFELSNEDPLLLFETVKNAMKALRETIPNVEEKIDLQREVFMRRSVQAAFNEMYGTIAVVCGAWHAPALEQTFKQKDEKELIKDLKKNKVECTWIPWTNDRLMAASGYGAGIVSPGYYDHQWFHPEDDGTLWMTKTAREFRNQKMDISSAHVIEAVRLCQSLASLRGLNKSGLKEAIEATQTVMCMGDYLPITLLNKGLIIGNKIGAIPDSSPQSPLQIDFEKQCKSLRLKSTEGETTLTLDLRKPLDLNKSIFLHRLMILGVDWGKKDAVNSKGTFKEQWRLYWKPEMLIELIAKSAMGNSIEIAADFQLREIVEKETTLKAVAEWLELSIPAELSKATPVLLQKMDKLAAAASDIEMLITALFPLSEILKYGNVRQSDKEGVNDIFTSIFYRTLVGLPMGCVNINVEQAMAISTHIKRLHKVILVLDEYEFTQEWHNTLQKLGNNDQIAPYIGGVVQKIALESDIFTAEATAGAFSRALSVGMPIETSAQWLEGFLHDAATILLLDEQIWTIVYEWVATLDEEPFKDLLPILRRTFSEYTSPEKDKLAQKVKRGPSSKSSQVKPPSINLDNDRAQQVIPVIEYLLGL